jgi:hypothetical protein
VNESKGSLNVNEGFFDRSDVIKWSLRIFYSICIMLLAVDFIIHRHVETDIEKIPAFYVVYAFLACVLFVLIANQLRKLLMREDHYYTKDEDLIKKDDE